MQQTDARLVIEAEYVGHEAFWIVANDTTAGVETESDTAEFYPEAERRTDFDEYESLIDISKARVVLGWEPQRTWRTL
jgi:nucleoside-diphosphate-sugar epimerase